MADFLWSHKRNLHILLVLHEPFFFLNPARICETPEIYYVSGTANAA